MVELNESHVALSQPACEQAASGKGAGLFRVWPIKIENALRFVGRGHQLRDGGLHPVGHLVLFDTCGDFGIVHDLQVSLVYSANAIEDSSTDGRAHPGRIRKIEYRVALRAELNTLMDGGQETASPVPRAQILTLSRSGDEDDEGRQVAILAAEPIRHP